MNQLKKYKYQKLDYKAPRERSCYTVGRVYRYNPRSTNLKRDLLVDDTLLCIRKSGDCHYDFIRIEEETRTSYSGNGPPPFQIFVYFKLSGKSSHYGGLEEAFPKMETLSKTDLVHALYSGQVLIPLSVVLTDEALSNLEEQWGLEAKLSEIRMKSLTEGKHNV